ncbi:hypothetical protein [Herbiconiux liangxiaofengii]|uniref:hypothetical protein n=1 Tax=Herbiconiux liangxiaofengii TaxID=3342795 RepID=UPI0035BB60F3
MDRRLLIALWAVSGLSTLVFVFYYGSVMVSFSRGGEAGSQVLLVIGGGALLIAAVVAAAVGVVGQVRLARLRQAHPESTIERAQVRPGWQAFAARYSADDRPFGGVRLDLAEVRYAAFGGRMLTLLSADGREVVSFDSAYAGLSVERLSGPPVVMVAVEGFPRLALGFPRAWTFGALQLPEEELWRLVGLARG